MACLYGVCVWWFNGRDYLKFCQLPVNQQKLIKFEPIIQNSLSSNLMKYYNKLCRVHNMLTQGLPCGDFVVEIPRNSVNYQLNHENWFILRPTPTFTFPKYVTFYKSFHEKILHEVIKRVVWSMYSMYGKHFQISHFHSGCINC